MTIADIRVHRLAIPAKPLAVRPLNHTSLTRHTLIEIETEDGRIGIGEAFRLAPGSVSALILDELRPLLVGQDERGITALTASMRRATFRYGRKGVAPIAISGVEIALWDLLGQRTGCALVDLLGGRCGASLRAYASMPRYATPKAAAAAAAGFMAEGYAAVKLHQDDPHFAAATRAAIGPEAPLMFDAGGAWSPRAALEAAAIMAPHGVLWLEEPLARMDDYAGLAALAARSAVPIAGGENEYTVEGFAVPVAARSFDILQPDVAKCGGIGETRKIIALANAHNLPVALHAFCHGPALLATAHLSLATEGLEWLEMSPVVLEAEFLHAPIRVIDGCVAVPDCPRVGRGFHEEALHAFAI